MSLWNDEIEPVKTSMEIDESISIQKAGWKVQSAGLIVIATVVLLAALGFFGDGVLSHRVMRHENASVGFERFFRHQAPLELSVIVTGTSGASVISFPEDYLHAFEIKSINPEPKRIDVAGGNIHYTFESKGDLSIVFHMLPQRSGNIGGVAKVNDHPFHLKHFIFP
jgi:hypothetical protein